ncbi:hypothetical protein ACK6T8_25180, partial [Klebsiella pneumoniae]|uniref:hypothetical protein n=1 Tax=Klebsiella pneumoniae TaxID=573 RepID=UPI0039B640B6
MSNEIDVNDIVPLLDPATEIGDEIFRGNGMFADEEGYKAPSQNGGIYDDIDGLEIGFAPIFPDTCYHLTHYWPAAADIPV